MGKARTLESYKEEFYRKFPDKQNIIFIEKQKTHFLIQNKYGLCKVAITHLMDGYCPTIRVALNKTEYFINQAKEVHKDKYTYEKSIYNGVDTNLIITCKIHGDFLITPHSFIVNKCGCRKCGYIQNSIKNGNNPTGWGDTDWFTKAKKSKNYDSFKVYIIKCWNNEEDFYKIGKTFRSLKQRLTFVETRMPYNYEVINIIEYKELTLENAKIISKLERELKELNKGFEYVPLKNIRGKFECFSKIK